MPTWLIPLFKNLLSGFFGFITREKARAEKERVEGLKAQHESIRRAAAEEQKIQAALRSGVNIHNSADWNRTVDQWKW